MTLDELTRETTHHFSWACRGDELANIWKHIAEAISGEVRIYCDQTEVFNFERSQLIGAGHSYELNINKLTGTIRGLKESVDFTCVKQEPRQRDAPEMYSGIEFDVFPYKRYEDIPALRRLLMESVKATLGNYFLKV